MSVGFLIDFPDPPSRTMHPIQQRILALASVSVLAMSLHAGAAQEAVLLHDSILEPEAHYFPRITYSVPTVHGVTFQQEGVVTYNGWQFATFYNADGHVSVGRRPLPGGEWETLTLTDYTFTNVDSHNSVVLGICEGDGSIHLSFDHHNHTLKYRKSRPGAADNPETTDWSADLFGPITDRLGDDGPITDLTYPRFIPAPDKSLLFTYRTGGSGAGDDFMFEYDPATGQWTRIGLYISRAGAYDGPFTPGSTSRNPYQDNTVFDNQGRLHATWCWRETPDPRSNHDIYYAYSEDHGRTWKNQAGETVATADTNPIRVDTPGVKVREIPQNRNYINNSGMTVDAEGRVHVMAWHFPDSVPDLTSGFSTSLDSAARFHHYWSDSDGTWHRNETDLTGTRPKLVADADGHLYLAYGSLENLRIATATPESNWSDWSEMTLPAALPEGRAREVNLIIDPLRWEKERVLSLYAQETNPTGTGTAPTPLHVLDYHVSRGAAQPSPSHESSRVSPETAFEWTPGRTAVAHDVYIGLTREAVANATPDSPDYQGRQTDALFQPTPALREKTEYFWRIDAVDSQGAVTPGKIWSFTTVDLAPEVSLREFHRTHGGRATLSARLGSVNETAAEITLHWGSADHGEDPTAWPRTITLGTRLPGDITATVDGVREEAFVLRLRAANDHGETWSAPAILPAGEDLARWKYHAPVELDFDSDIGPLTDFPVLLHLGPIPPDAPFLSPPHGDLRFSDPSGTRILPHEIEHWDPDGVSLVWVRVPRLDGPTRLLAWWGREGRTAPSPTESSTVWSADYAAVLHLRPTAVATDSSPAASTGAATALSPATPGIVGHGANFNGPNSHIRIPNSAALNPNQITLETWIRTTQTSGNAAIVNKDRTSGGFDRVWQFRLNNGHLEFIVFTSSGNHSVVSNTLVADGTWRHLAGSWDGETVRLYVDGALDASSPYSGSLQSGQSNDLLIGRGENNSPDYFRGDLDEIRLSRTARSADWIQAGYQNQQQATSVQFGLATLPDLDDDLLPDAWEMDYFSTLSLSDGRDSDASAHTNVPPLLAFATGTDPRTPTVFPHAVIATESTEEGPTFTYDQLSGGTGIIGVDYTVNSLRYLPEFSTDLVTWLAGDDFVEWTGASQPLGNGIERVTVRFLPPEETNVDRLFARLRIVPM